jgi:hypothetical protein
MKVKSTSKPKFSVDSTLFACWDMIIAMILPDVVEVCIVYILQTRCLSSSVGAGSQQDLNEGAENQPNGETEKAELVPREPETPTEDNNNSETTKEKLPEKSEEKVGAEESQFGGSSVFIRDSEDEGDSVDAVPYYEDVGRKVENVIQQDAEDVIQQEAEDVVKPEVNDSDTDGEEVVEEIVEVYVIENETVVPKESVVHQTADDSGNEEVEESDVLNALDENVTAKIDEDEMPGKEEDELSSSLQTATCRYRWAKTLRTNSQDVVFFPSYKMVRKCAIKLILPMTQYQHDRSKGAVTENIQAWLY